MYAKLVPKFNNFVTLSQQPNFQKQFNQDLYAKLNIDHALGGLHECPKENGDLANGSITKLLIHNNVITRFCSNPNHDVATTRDCIPYYQNFVASLPDITKERLFRNSDLVTKQVFVSKIDFQISMSNKMFDLYFPFITDWHQDRELSEIDRLVHGGYSLADILYLLLRRQDCFNSEYCLLWCNADCIDNYGERIDIFQKHFYMAPAEICEITPESTIIKSVGKIITSSEQENYRTILEIAQLNENQDLHEIIKRLETRMAEIRAFRYTIHTFLQTFVVLDLVPITFDYVFPKIQKE